MVDLDSEKTNIKNNDKHENIIDVEPQVYRYVRLYIEKANRGTCI